MRVERSSLDQVKKRFEVNKKKLEEKQKEYDFEERMKELREEVRPASEQMMQADAIKFVVSGRFHSPRLISLHSSGGESQSLQEGETEGEETPGGGRRGFGGRRRDGGSDGLLGLRLLKEESLMRSAPPIRTGSWI